MANNYLVLYNGSTGLVVALENESDANKVFEALDSLNLDLNCALTDSKKEANKILKKW